MNSLEPHLSIANRSFVLEKGQNFELDLYREVIQVEGFALISLSFSDQTGKTFSELVSTMGESNSHDLLGRQVWDVKYDHNVNQESGTRSLTLREFPMHTDASFETPPPKYVALYVVRPDRLGGGLTQLLDSRKIFPLLSAQSKATLRETFFTISVPEEFSKSGEKTVRAPLLDDAGNFRFRSELLITEDLEVEQARAVAELQLLLEGEEWVQSFSLATGSILLFDNGRMFHARTAVLDRERHLLRMRFS